MKGEELMAAPTTILQVQDTLICAGIAEMWVPEGGAHVRAVDIRIPTRFAGRPTVTATVHALTGPASAGVAFGVYSIKVNELGPAETQIAIEAANVSREGAESDSDFVCHFVVVGNATPRTDWTSSKLASRRSAFRAGTGRWPELAGAVLPKPSACPSRFRSEPEFEAPQPLGPSTGSLGCR